MFFKRVTLFRFFGFKVKADASWIFLSALIAWTLASNTYPRLYPGHALEAYQLMAFATLAGILVSIIAHEVAHAVIAEYYHMPIASITLFIFGGVAEMRGEPSHPKGEFLMAIAGPIMSALMGLFFFALSRLLGMYAGEGAASQALDYLGTINMLIAVFNMVPAFPLDGGRALRAVIWHIKKNLVLATRIASELGAVFAYGLLVYACWKIIAHDDLVNGMWLGLLGLFVHGSGAYAVRQTESRSLLGMETVSRFMHDRIVTVSPDLTVNELVDKYVYQHYQRIFPVVDGGRFAGVVTLQTLLSMDRHKWHWLHVASVMEQVTPDNTVPPDFNAADALDLMQRLGKDALLVANEGKFLGVVNLRDLAAYLSVTMKIDHNRPVVSSRKA